MVAACSARGGTYCCSGSDRLYETCPLALPPDVVISRKAAPPGRPFSVLHFFTQLPWDEMDVYVWHIFPYDRKLDIVSAMLFLKFYREFAGNFEQIIRNVIRQFPKPLIMLYRYYEGVARSYRVIVGKRHYLVILVMCFFARNFSSNDFAENTLIHAGQYTMGRHVSAP